MKTFTTEFSDDDLINKGWIDKIIESLGEPVERNEYIIKPYNGEWWIEHKHVGSGEPLRQFLISN